MWRLLAGLRGRLRLSTLLFLTIILGMGAALFVQQQREARLLSALRSARSFTEEAIRTALDQPADCQNVKPQTLESVLGWVKTRSRLHADGILWKGIPIYVDPVGLEEAGVTLSTAVRLVPRKRVPLKVILRDVLDPLKLDYVVDDGMLTITSRESVGRPPDGGSSR